MTPGCADGQEDVHSFDASAHALALVVAGIDDDRLDGPTPSGTWTVGDLLGHVQGLARGLAATARKQPPPADTLQDGGPGPGWRAELPAQLRAMAQGWADPAAWEGTTTAGTVELPAHQAGMFALDELVVHGWELARATGQAYAPDPAAVDACATFLERTPRAPELFGPVVEVGPEASPIERLVALTGRDPGWRP